MGPFVYLRDRGLAGLAVREGNPLNATNFWTAWLAEGREGGVMRWTEGGEREREGGVK